MGNNSISGSDSKPDFIVTPNRVVMDISKDYNLVSTTTPTKLREGNYIMSQFMICKANFDLKKYGGRSLILNEKKDEFFFRVLREHNIKEYDNVWIIGNIDDYCSEQLHYNDFFVSKFYYFLNDLYDLCEWMILWYGNEYGNLDEVYAKDEFINYIQRCMEVPACELYVRVECN